MQKLILPLLAALGACHAAMDDMSSMQSAVVDMRRETVRHLDAARAAPTLIDMRAEMARHRDGMTEMRGMHGDLDHEWTQHLQAIESANDVAAAVDEVERHASAMLGMMDGMDVAMTAMSCH